MLGSIKRKWNGLAKRCLFFWAIKKVSSGDKQECGRLQCSASLLSLPPGYSSLSERRNNRTCHFNTCEMPEVVRLPSSKWVCREKDQKFKNGPLLNGPPQPPCVPISP